MEKSEFKELIKEAISNLPKQPTEDDSTFDKLAKLILKKGLLSVNRAKFRFVEIEFYLNNVTDKKSEIGYDPFAHTHDDKRFRETITGGFRPHYSGLDIAIREDDFFGGILIRGVQKIEPQQILLRGPLVSMCAIVGEIGNLTLDDSDLFKLTFKMNGNVPKIEKTKRIGFGKHKHSGGVLDSYRDIRWRYYIHIEKP